MSIRVLLADDHRIFLDGIRHLLDQQPSIDVVGEVYSGKQAIEVLAEVRPTVVVMDLSMPGMNGIEATRHIVAENPETKVLCLSMHSETRFVEAALDAGASGYLLKECALSELVRAIGCAARGETYLSPRVAGVIVEACRSKLTKTNAFSVLTDREREVLQRIAEGEATKSIAARLNVSIKTVGTHRDRIMHKLEIHSVAGLTKYAVREGLTALES